MVNAQEWLDKNYPLEMRKEIKEIKVFLLFKRLKGELDLEGFTNLEKFDCSGNKVDNLFINNCPQLKKINCSDNRLTNLTINNCPNLIKLDCNYNYLTDLSFIDNLNSRNLEKLNISDNNFAEQDLFFCNRLVNLKELFIGNLYIPFSPKSSFMSFLNLRFNLRSAFKTEEKLKRVNKKNICNRFVGSLKPLQSLTKLECLGISYTDINSGLEYLPDSIKIIFCLSYRAKPKKKVKELAKQLKKFGPCIGHRDSPVVIFSTGRSLKKWKRANNHLVELAKSKQLGNSIQEFKEYSSDYASASTHQTIVDLDQWEQNNLYKEFFIKQTKLNKLKSKLNEEEREWLDIYCAAQVESKSSNFAQQQLEKARNKLNKRLSNEEIEEVLDEQKKLVQLQKKLENLQEQEFKTQIEISPLGQEVRNLGRE